jgi:hypothetical protein
VSYAGTQPYVSGIASGGLTSTPPGAGSGVTNKVDAGYVLIAQTPALVIAAAYFPAGIAGGLAAETARLAAVAAGNTAILMHLDGGRILPDGWSIP